VNIIIHRYTYDYLLQKAGKITVQVILSGPGIYSDYYANDAWSNPIAFTNIISDLNFNWGDGDVIPGHNNYVSAVYYICLKGNY